MATLFYEIDFQELVKMLVPVRLRKTIMLAWLQCLVRPVKELYDSFYANRRNNIYMLHHNSQLVYLQAVLNDTFDFVDRRIYIIDGAVADPLYTYLTAETQPLWLGLQSEAGITSYPYPQWLYTYTETAYSGYAFIVMVPYAVFFDPSRMAGLINRYRLPSKTSYHIIGF